MTTSTLKNFRKCRDDSLVKKVWGQGLGWNMFKNDLMPTLHKSHTPKYPYMWCIHS